MSLTGRTRTSDLGMTTEFTVPRSSNWATVSHLSARLVQEQETKWFEQDNRDGTRTRNRWIRSPARYPLRHTVCRCLDQRIGSNVEDKKRRKERESKRVKQKCMELMSAQRYFSTRKKMALQKNKVWTWSVLLLVSMKRSIERKTTGRQTAVNLKFFFPSSKARRRRKKLKASEWEKNSNRIGLNESQCKNCSWQVQLPRALMPKRQTNELCAHGYKFQSCEFAHKS